MSGCFSVLLGDFPQEPSRQACGDNEFGQTVGVLVNGVFGLGHGVCVLRLQASSAFKRFNWKS